VSRSRQPDGTSVDVGTRVKNAPRRHGEHGGERRKSGSAANGEWSGKKRHKHGTCRIAIRERQL
jgi:hypothetical protein